MYEYSGLNEHTGQKVNVCNKKRKITFYAFIHFVQDKMCFMIIITLGIEAEQKTIKKTDKILTLSSFSFLAKARVYGLRLNIFHNHAYYMYETIHFIYIYNLMKKGW